MNKTLLVLSMVVLFTLAIVSARPPFEGDIAQVRPSLDIITGNVDYECTQAGFDFGIAKWEWNDDDAYVREGSDRAGYVTSVVGNSQSFVDWTSVPGAAGVLTKEANDYFLHLGGESGSIDQGQHGISHVSICGDEAEDVPEFGIFAAFGVLALAGLFIYKRRD